MNNLKKMEKIKTAGWFDKVCGYLVQSLDARLLLVFILLLKFSFNLIEGEFILTKEVYYESYSRDFSDEQVEQIWDVKQESKFISSALGICGFLLLVAINAALLSTILFAFGRSNSIATSFKIVLIASLPYIVQETIKILWFLSANEYVLEDVLNFHPGSFYGLLDSKTSSFAARTIVGNLSVTLIISMAMIVGITANTQGISLKESLRIVSIGYFFVFFLLASVVFFIQVPLS